MDADTGQVRWKYHAEKPVVAGVTPTAGGVTFTGDLNGNLLVFNSKTGELVNKVKTDGALAGGVVTYEAAGKQYVAFASGNVSRNAFGALGVPSVVIMGLRDPRTAPAASNGSSRVGTADLAKGRKVYEQVCASCHGPDGNLVAGHALSTLASRRDRASTLRYIKNPKPPMPKLYPGLLNEQSLVDVTSYIYEDLAH